MRIQKPLLFFCMAVTCVAYWSCSICSKKISCPGFEDEVLNDWFPYTLNTKLKFVTNTNQSQTFTLATVSASEPYNSTQSMFGPRQYCSATKTILSAEKDATGASAFMMQMIKEDEPNPRRIDMHLLGVDLNSYEFNETGFTYVTSYADPAKLESHASIQLNGKQFTNVQSIRFDTSFAKHLPVYKFYIAKNNGLVAYETYGQPSLLWVKE